MYKIKKINGKTCYYSTLVDTEHFFTTRELVVKDNIDLICNYLKIKRENFFHPHQVHSDNVEFISSNKKEYPDCDGLIIDKKGYGAFLSFADCTPVILYDKKNVIAAVVHAGWRGTAQKIAPKALKLMIEKYQTKPSDIVSLIGPCISFKHFETSTEAIEALSTTVEDKKGLFSGRYADLKGINKRQLEEMGVKAFDICPFCTIDDNDKFFSYRKENATKLRHSAVVCLK